MIRLHCEFIYNFFIRGKFQILVYLIFQTARLKNKEYKLSTCLQYFKKNLL